MQFIYNAADVPSLSEDLLHTVDVVQLVHARRREPVGAPFAGRRRSGCFPGKTHGDLLGTFTPPDATVDTHVRANEIASPSAPCGPIRCSAKRRVHVHHYQTDVLPQGGAPMQLLPDTTLGNFFNEQHRDTATYQVIATVSGSKTSKCGSHLFKGGVDLLRNAYDGTSVSRPVLIERDDGTLARSLIYAGADGAVVADDRRRAVRAGSISAERALVRRVRRPSGSRRRRASSST